MFWSRKEIQTLPRPRTICTLCRHHVEVSVRGGAYEWYGHKCAAVVTKPRHIDPVTGQTKADALAYCCDVNKDGECPHYDSVGQAAPS